MAILQRIIGLEKSEKSKGQARVVIAVDDLAGDPKHIKVDGKRMTLKKFEKFKIQAERDGLKLVILHLVYKDRSGCE